MKKPKGTTLKGKKINIFSERLCDKIRKRLNLTEKQLPNKLIREVTKFLNFKLGDFILENREGMQLAISENKPNGVLAISKHLPKEMRDDKFDMFDRIQELEIPDFQKKILLKRYDTNVKRRLKYKSSKAIKDEFNVNPHSFFYCYRIMWFNKRNCKIKKASAYRFEAVTNLKRRLTSALEEGMDYDELHFHNFYRLKLKTIL